MATIAVGSIVTAYEDIGTGEPLVLVHGGESSRTEYTKGFVPYLGDGIRALPYDQRDSGETKNDDSPYTMSDLARDCAAFIEALGLDQAHLMGGSYGGMIALRVAIEHPQRVRSLVLRSTSPGGAVSAEDLARGIDAVDAEIEDGPAAELALGADVPFLHLHRELGGGRCRPVRPGHRVSSRAGTPSPAIVRQTR